MGAREWWENKERRGGRVVDVAAALFCAILIQDVMREIERESLISHLALAMLFFVRGVFRSFFSSGGGCGNSVGWGWRRGKELSAPKGRARDGIGGEGGGGSGRREIESPRSSLTMSQLTRHVDRPFVQGFLGKGLVDVTGAFFVRKVLHCQQHHWISVFFEAFFFLFAW